MHDPLTVAFEIGLPWPCKMKDGSRQWERHGLDLLTIWHKDPEKGGDDDSCGWFKPNLTKKEIAFAHELIENPYDNVKYWFPKEDDDREMVHKVCHLFRNFKRLHRPWWRHPRWHFWHWQFQVHGWKKFMRWAFSRCGGCGGRFRWGESPVGLGWSGGRRSRWTFWKGEQDVWHTVCYPVHPEKGAEITKFPRNPGLQGTGTQKS